MVEPNPGTSAERQMITLTDKAVEEIRKLVDPEEGMEPALRVAVQGGGCAGFSYVLKFDTDVGETDEVLYSGGVKVIVDRKSLSFLEGSSIDFVTSPVGSGFKVRNPKAARSCACGNSFSL